MSQPTPYICPTCHKKHMPGQNCFTSTLQGAPASQSYSISPNVPFYRTPYGQFELTLTFRPTSDQTRSNPQWDPSQNLSAPPRSLMYREEDEIAGVPGFGPSRGFNQYENYTQNMQNKGREQLQNTRIGGQRSAYPREAIPHTLPGSSYASGYQSSAGSVYHERGAEFPQFQSIEPPSHGMQSNANFDQNSNYLAQAEGHSSTAPWPMQRMDQTSVYSSPVKKKDPLNPYAPVYDSSSDLNASPSPPTASWRETVPSEEVLRQGKNSIDDLQTPDEYNLPQARLGTVSRNPEFVSATSNDPAYSFYSTSPPYTSKFNTSATASGYTNESTPFYSQASQNQPPRLPDASMTADDKWAAQPNPSQCQSYTTPWSPSEFAYLKLGSYDNLTLWKGYNRPQEAASNIICSTDLPGRVPDQPETCLETEDPCQTPVIGFPTTGALGPKQSEPELPLEAHDRQAQLPEPSIAADVEQPDENAPALSYAQALASKAKAAPVMYTHHSPITMQVEWQRYKSCYTRLFDRIDARDAHMFGNKSEVAFCRMCQKKRLVPISEMLPHLLYEHRCSCCDRLIPGKDLADHIKERNCVKCGKHKTECFMAHINHEKTCRRKPKV